MIHSFIFSEGKLVGRDLEPEALRLVHGDKGLIVWVDLENPTDEETKAVLEQLFQFHPLAIEDCLTPSPLPKIEDYEDYLPHFVHTFAGAEQCSASCKMRLRARQHEAISG